MTVQLQKYHFTVDEFYRMAEAGIFSEDDRVELIEGEIVEMTPIGDRHANCVRRLIRLLSRKIREQAILDVQNPLRLAEHSEPQPDLLLLKPTPDLYRKHPQPQDVLLLIEVADTSQEYDRQTKVPLYARAGIPEVWIVDLAAETVEIYRDPSAEGYRQIQTAKRGQRVSCQDLPVHVTVDEVLG